MPVLLRSMGIYLLLLLTPAACAFPLSPSSGWAYNSRTNTCERSSPGFGSLTEEECGKQLVAAVTAQAIASVTAYARSLPTATFTPRPPTRTPVPTNTRTPRPPTSTPLPTSTRISTPAPSLTPLASSLTRRGDTTATIVALPARGPLATHFFFELEGFPQERVTEWAIVDPEGQVTTTEYPLSWVAENDEPPGIYRVTASVNGRVVAEGTFEVVHDGQRAPPRLTTIPEKGRRGTRFALTFSGGPPGGTVDWLTRLPDGRVNRVPMQLNASGNYLEMSYATKATDPLGVYRHEIVRGGTTLATATFELTQ